MSLVSQVIRLVSLTFFLYFLKSVTAEGEGVSPLVTPEAKPIESLDPLADVVEETIRKFEQKAVLTEKVDREAILPFEETEKQYEDMVGAVDQLIELAKTPNNMYKFLKARGFDRVILPSLTLYHTDLRNDILILTKLLFEIAPTTTSMLVPITVVDKLLDIFETDVSVPIKGLVLDILHIWLPGNPKVQARLMKVKGLEPFYEQINKLDPAIVHTALDLFNVIIKEHSKARNENDQQTKTALLNLNIYKKIGLIEKLSTPTVCNALLTMFHEAWAFSLDEDDIIVPILELIKNIGPYCLEIYGGNAEAYEVFENLQNYLEDDVKNKTIEYASLGLNITETKEMLQNYVTKLKYTIKDEF